jgi:hypothetical protein
MVIALHIEIAINEHRTLPKSTPERLLTIQVEITAAIDGGTIQGIVRTLEMAILVIGILRTVERIQIKATDETYLLGRQAVAMELTYMSLGDDCAAFWPI